MLATEREASEVASAVNSICLKAWFEELLKTDKTELEIIIGELVNVAKISQAALEEARASLPSVSAVQWASFATRFHLNMDPNLIFFEIGRYETPVYRLPPSFHKQIIRMSWWTQDAYRERVDQFDVAGRLRLLDPYIVPVLALFEGRLVDKHNQVLSGKAYPTGRDVPHKVCMMAGAMFIIVGTNQLYRENDAARIFLELFALAECNIQQKFEGLRVYGLLTDSSRFEFYSYNPATSRFYLDQQIIVSIKRDEQAMSMIKVTNKIFSVMFTAYLDGLRSVDQADEDEQIKQWLITSPTTEKQKLTDPCRTALELAEQSQAQFMEHAGTIRALERKSKKALLLLSSSVRSIPRESLYTVEDEPADLEALAHYLVTKEYEEASGT